jgi:hypothetical protein
MAAIPEDPAALRPVTVKVIGARHAAAAVAAAAAAAADGAAPAAAAAPDNDAPDVQTLTIQASPQFTKSQLKAAIERAGGPPVARQRLLLSNVDALTVVDRAALGGGGGGAGAGAAAGKNNSGGMSIAPCGVASSAALALSGQPAVEAPTAKK